jgi:hypothetical protein
MKTNGNDSANPVGSDILEKHSLGYFKNAGERNPFGLTKREHLAAMAMQGMLTIRANWDKVDLANSAVKQADALIAALNTKP